MSTRQVQDYVKRLRRRVEFLEQRTEDKPEEKSHYDRAELLALKWVVAYIEDTELEASEHQSKWFESIK